jgi:hypothetical protein
VVPNVNDKCPEWGDIYNGPGAGADEIGLTTLISRVAAPSADGKVIYVAGKSDADPSSVNDNDYVVTAYDTGTGAERWVSRYGGTADLPQAAAVAIAVDPNGARVFVTGIISSDDGSLTGVATVAFAANTGQELWTSVFQEPALTTTADFTISPDGKRLYVPCQISFQDGEGVRHNQAVTVAYDAASGALLWLSRYSGNPGERTFAQKVAAHPDGSRVYVAAGKIDNEGFASDIMLLIYDSLTGALEHETHYLTQGFLIAGMAMSPDGSRVFIEQANYFNRLNAALTLAYDAAGNQLWMARSFGCAQTGCANRPWYNEPIAVSPDGTRVFVSSLNNNPQTQIGFMTEAYDAATGEQEWATRYDATDRSDCFCSPPVTVNRNGEEVYISGVANLLAVVPGTTGASTGNFATIAYDVGTGTQKWTAMYTPAGGSSSPGAIAVSPYDERLFVAGHQRDSASGNLDVVTLAYPTGVLPSLRPIKVLSRKTHGAANFDVDLPVAGNPGIECRVEPQFGSHHIVFQFASAVTISGASVTPAAGQAAEMDGSPSVSANGKEVTVNLKNVTNAQTITVTLHGVSDGTLTNDVAAPLALLAGDTTGDGVVNSADIAQTKSQSGSTLTMANFREDVTGDGSVNSADISLVKSKSGTALP